MSATDPLTSESTPLWWRIGGVLGLFWALLFIIGGVILHGTPLPYDDPIQQARHYFQSGSQTYLIGDYLARLGFVFGFLPFAATLQSRLGAGEREPRILSRLLFGAALLVFAVGDGSKFFLNAVALAGGSSDVSDASLRALLYLDAVSIATIGAPAALMVFAASWLIWKQRTLWRWIAIVGACSGVLLVLGAAFPLERRAMGILFAVRGVSFLGLLIFVVVCSLNLLLSGGTARTRTTEKQEARATGTA